MTLSRGLICIVYAKNRPIGWYLCCIGCSSFVLCQIKNLRAPFLKLLKIPFQRNLQIQNRPSGSRDIRLTRAGTWRKVPLGWILSALCDLIRVYKVSFVIVWCILRHKFDEKTFKTHSKALWRLSKLLEAPRSWLQVQNERTQSSKMIGRASNLARGKQRRQTEKTEVLSFSACVSLYTWSLLSRHAKL